MRLGAVPARRLAALVLFVTGCFNLDLGLKGHAADLGDVSPVVVIPIKIDRLDAAANMLVPEQARVEKVATGFRWVEGPLWLPSGRLIFAEVGGNRIQTWSPDGAAGKVDVFLTPSGYQGSAPYGGSEPGSNGMALDKQGRLTVAGHAQRDVYRLEKSEAGSLQAQSQVTILADSYRGKRLNSPNDLVYRSDGSIYFTDPPYGLRTQNDSDPEKQLTVSGVYRIPAAQSQKHGAEPDRARLQLVEQDLPRPNGLAFSPDERYLYVDNSEPEMLWLRYEVKADGALLHKKVLYDAGPYLHHGAPDGMKVDQQGNIYSAGPGGVWIFSQDGKHLATIEMPETVGNVAWGGDDYKTLYIAANTSVYRIRLTVPGSKVPE